jgi:hypothetical protein
MRKVSYAKLHAPFFSVGTGNLKDTLSPKEYTGMEIYETSTGLEVKYKGIHFFIPATNVVGYVIEAEKVPYKIVPKEQ